MKTLIKSALLLLLVMSLTGCGDDVSSISSDDLVERNGLYYKKFSDIPFSGKVTQLPFGLKRGLMKNGKIEGEWITYNSASLLDSIGNYKNGKREGEWVGYWDDGQLYSRGNFKNGKKEGAWVEYKNDGTLNRKRSGTFKNGTKIND